MCGLKQNHILYLVEALVVIGLKILLIYGWELMVAGNFAIGIFVAVIFLNKL